MRFLDHTMASGDEAGLIQCDVWGLLVGETKNAYTVATWVCGGAVKNHNTEVFTILKHKGLKIKKLGTMEYRFE